MQLTGYVNAGEALSALIPMPDHLTKQALDPPNSHTEPQSKPGFRDETKETEQAMLIALVLCLTHSVTSLTLSSMSSWTFALRASFIMIQRLACSGARLGIADLLH